MVDESDLDRFNKIPTTSGVLKEIQSKYQSDFRFFFHNNKLSVAVFDWDNIANVLSKKQSEFLKGRSEVIVGSAIGWGLLTEEAPEHRQQRAALTPAFHKLMQSQYLSAIKDALNNFDDEFSKPEGFNLTPVIRKLMYEISITGFMGFDKEQGQPEFEHHLYVIQKFLNSSTPESSAEMKQAVNQYRESRGFILDHIENLSRAVTDQSNQNQSSFQAGLVDLYGDEVIPGGGLYGQIGQFIAAGTETTSSLISSFLIELSQRPAEWEELAKEILSGNEELLNLYIRESLRLWAPASVISRVTINDVQLGEVLIPAGTEVFISPTVTHTMNRYYSNPDEFNPFREENKQSSSPYFPFGYGPRMCIGFQTAMTSAREILKHIITNYQPTEQQLSNDQFEEFFIRYPVRDMKLRLEASGKKINQRHCSGLFSS